MPLKTFNLAIEIIITGFDPPNTASTKQNLELVSLKIHFPSQVTKLKVIVFYSGHRFDSVFRENQTLCELQGEMTSDSEIAESKPWPHHKSSFRTSVVK